MECKLSSTKDSWLGWLGHWSWSKAVCLYVYVSLC